MSRVEWKLGNGKENDLLCSTFKREALASLRTNGGHPRDSDIASSDSLAVNDMNERVSLIIQEVVKEC